MSYREKVLKRHSRSKQQYQRLGRRVLATARQFSKESALKAVFDFYSICIGKRLSHCITAAFYASFHNRYPTFELTSKPSRIFLLRLLNYSLQRQTFPMRSMKLWQSVLQVPSPIVQAAACL